MGGGRFGCASPGRVSEGQNEGTSRVSQAVFRHRIAGGVDGVTEAAVCVSWGNVCGSCVGRGNRDNGWDVKERKKRPFLKGKETDDSLVVISSPCPD